MKHLGCFLFLLIAHFASAQSELPKTPVKTSEPDSLFTYIDGIKVRGNRDDFTYNPDDTVVVIVGGLPIHYGDVNGSVISIVEDDPQEPGSEAYITAMNLHRQGKFNEAIPFYDAAIHSDPTLARPYYYRAACKANSGDSEGAILDYDKAIELDNTYAKAYYDRGMAKISLLKSKTNAGEELTAEQTESACEDFRKAAQLDERLTVNQFMIRQYCNGN